MLRVAFAGLPSAGKSTMINALAGARFLETGVCRTTRAPCVLVAEDPGKQDIGMKCDWKRANMRSDDGISLCVVDLPGICDSENTGTESNFTDLTMQWAAHCDVVVWVTDVRTCFLTSHEKLEYEKLKDSLERVAVTTGRLFQFCVVLAKCDVDIVVANGANCAKGAKRVVAGEIVSPHEDTTVADCVDRAKRLFPGELIVAFNAFGRIIARESSDALRALAAQLAPNSRNVNTEFNMRWATADLHEKRQAQILRSILAALAKKTKVNRELVDALDESTTAMLMLLVLGVDRDDLRDATAWHHFAAAAGKGALLLPKNAELIGVLKHGPTAAKKHEDAIKTRFVDSKAHAPGVLVEAMMHMCGASCVVTARLYFKLPFLVSGAPGAPGAPGAICLLTPPSAMKAVPPAGYPAMLELDVNHNENRAIGTSLPWVNKVKEARVRLWGEAERDVCVTTVIALVREKLLPSVLSAPIGM